MKRLVRAEAVALLAPAVILLSACSTTPTNQQIATAAGAVIGVVAGKAVGGGTLGTLGGAASGAVIGNEIGKRR